MGRREELSVLQASIRNDSVAPVTCVLPTTPAPCLSQLAKILSHEHASPFVARPMNAPSSVTLLLAQIYLHSIGP